MLFSLLLLISTTFIYSQNNFASGLLYFNNRTDMNGFHPTARQSKVAVIQKPDAMVFVYSDSLWWAVDSNAIELIAALSDSIANAKSIYNSDGNTTGNRIVNAGSNDLTFNVDNGLSLTGLGGGGIALFEPSANGADNVIISAPNDLTGSYTITLPDSAPTSATDVLNVGANSGNTFFGVWGKPENLYNSNGTLSGSRTINNNSNTLSITNGPLNLGNTSNVGNLIFTGGATGSLSILGTSFNSIGYNLTLPADKPSRQSGQTIVTQSGGTAYGDNWPLVWQDIVTASTPDTYRIPVFTSNAGGLAGFTDFTFSTASALRHFQVNGTSQLNWPANTGSATTGLTSRATTTTNVIRLPLTVSTYRASGAANGIGTGIDFQLSTSVGEISAARIESHLVAADFLPELNMYANNINFLKVNSSGVIRWPGYNTGKDGTFQTYVALSSDGTVLRKGTIPILVPKNIAATTGNQTFNGAYAGRVIFEGGGSGTVTVTNNAVNISSIIVCTLIDNDATMTRVYVTANAGNFVLTADNIPTADTNVNFLIMN